MQPVRRSRRHTFLCINLNLIHLNLNVSLTYYLQGGQRSRSVREQPPWRWDGCSTFVKITSVVWMLLRVSQFNTQDQRTHTLSWPKSRPLLSVWAGRRQIPSIHECHIELTGSKQTETTTHLTLEFYNCCIGSSKVMRFILHYRVVTGGRETDPLAYILSALFHYLYAKPARSSCCLYVWLALHLMWLLQNASKSLLYSWK